MEGVICYVGIGSNMGDAARNCRQAIILLSQVEGVKVVCASSFYKTQPVIPEMTGGRSPEEIRQLENQDWFVNAVVEIRTTLRARKILDELLQIEASMGRKRTLKGGSRIIDMDLLFYGQDVIEVTGLSIPHPEAHRRRFVLEPMCEIASYFIHPSYGVSMRGLKDRLDDQNQVDIYRPEV